MLLKEEQSTPKKQGPVGTPGEPKPKGGEVGAWLDVGDAADTDPCGDSLGVGKNMTKSKLTPDERE